jgi:hypothetical protein
MPGISLNDIDQLPDPALELDVFLLLSLCNKTGELEKEKLSIYMHAKNWNSSRINKIVRYAMDRELLSNHSGLCITDKGRQKIGRN